MKKNKQKILFIYPEFLSFVKTDYEILSIHSKVIKYQFKPRKGIFGFIELIKQLIYIIAIGWYYDSFFIWFADYHSFLPVIFSRITNKKSYIVVGGYDICRVKSLNYGVFTSKFRGFFAYQSMKFSSCNIAVSKYVFRRLRWILPDSIARLVYNSVRLKNDGEKLLKKNLILTVGQIDNKQTYLRKGIDTFLEVARLLPHFDFIIIGMDQSKFINILQNIPSNIKIFERVPQEELIKFYSEAKLYAQFSRMDTFCLTLAEAMLFECIPIITNEGGMPEVAGKTGIIVKRNPALIAQIIQDNIELFINGEAAKNRILNNFLIEHRKKEIFKILENL